MVQLTVDFDTLQTYPASSVGVENESSRLKRMTEVATLASRRSELRRERSRGQRPLATLSVAWAERRAEAAVDGANEFVCQADLWEVWRDVRR